MQRTSKQLKCSESSAKRYLAVQRLHPSQDAKKTSSPFEIIGKIVQSDYTLAMANFNTTYCLAENSVVAL